MFFRWFNRTRLIITSKFNDITLNCPLCRKQCCDKPRIIYGVILEQCAICLEENPKDIVSLSCGHCFCRKCTKTIKYNPYNKLNLDNHTTHMENSTHQTMSINVPFDEETEIEVGTGADNIYRRSYGIRASMHISWNQEFVHRVGLHT